MNVHGKKKQVQHGGRTGQWYRGKTVEEMWPISNVDAKRNKKFPQKKCWRSKKVNRNSHGAQSIFKGIREQEICNWTTVFFFRLLLWQGTTYFVSEVHVATAYFSRLIERGWRLFCIVNCGAIDYFNNHIRYPISRLWGMTNFQLVGILSSQVFAYSTGLCTIFEAAFDMA